MSLEDLKLKTDDLNKWKNAESKESDDRFSQTKKLLNEEELKDKKDNILRVLEDWNLQEVFENLLLSEDWELCIMWLIESPNNETEIKKVILANLPEWYVYNVSTDKVVKVEVKKTEDYTWATITDRKWEQAQADTEQAQADTEQAQADTENNNESHEYKKALENMNLALEERSRLTEKYTNLDSITNENSDNYQNVKFQLEESWVLNQLKESGHDNDFINDYILVQATLQELKSNPTNYDQNDISYFDKIVKSLNNSCNIPDTKLSSFSQENISETRRDLFDKDIWNDKLRKTRDGNMASHEETYDEIFPEMWEDDMFIKYGQFLEWNLKNYWDQYKDDYPGFMNHLNDLREQVSKWKILNQEEKDFLSLPWTIKWIKEKMDNDTKNMIEELCIISQIKWMYMCMWEWANFDLNKANEIESEDWILTLNGHIDWVDFSIRQNTKKEEPLQTSTKLFKETNFEDKADKKENFVIWWKDSFVDSNYVLPTQDEIFTTITEIIQFDKTLVNYDNQDKYLGDLQANIMWKMEEKYDKTKYIHDYMQDQVKWEKIIDKTISFVENIKGNKIASEVGNSNAKLYDFLNLMNYNIRNSTEVEKNNFLRVMDKIDEMTTLAQNNPTDWELDNHKDNFAKYLTGNTLLKTKDILEWKPVEWESTQYSFDLFKNYENKADWRKDGELYMINFDQMLNDLNTIQLHKKEEEMKKTDDDELARIEDFFDGKTEEYPIESVT